MEGENRNELCCKKGSDRIDLWNNNRIVESLEKCSFKQEEKIN